MPVVLATVAAVVAYFVLAAQVRASALRGTVVGVVLGVHCFAWSPVVPLDVRDAVVVATVVVLVLVAVSPTCQAIRRPSAVAVLLVVLFVGASVVTFVAYPPGFGYTLRLSALVVGLVMVLSQSTVDDRAALVTGLLVVGSLQAACGLVEVVIGEPVLWGYKAYDTDRGLWNENTLLRGEIARVQGTMSHPLPFSALVSVALMALWSHWSRFGPIVRRGLLVLFVVALVLSGSRSAIGASALAATLLLFTAPGTSTWRKGGLAAAGAAAVLLTSWSTVRESVTSLLDSGSFVNRAGHFPAVPRLLGRPVLEAFFGSGESSEARLFADGYFYGTGFNVVDNQWISTLATQGLLGAVLLSAVFVVAFTRGSRDVRAMLIVMTAALVTFDFFKMTAVVVLLVVVACLDAVRAETDVDGPAEVVGDERPDNGQAQGRRRVRRGALTG